MSSLSDLRIELADTLSSLGVNTYTHLPGKATPPSCIVMAGSPYVETGQTFGEHLVRLEAWVSTQKGDNESEAMSVDALTEQAITALMRDGWVIESVSQPFSFEINNGQFLTTAITVTTPVTLT